VAVKGVFRNYFAENTKIEHFCMDKPLMNRILFFTC